MKGLRVAASRALIVSVLAVPLVYVAPQAASAADPYTGITLQNGWTNAPFSTRNASVSLGNGNIVTLSGAISTLGTNPVAFTLPSFADPDANVYVPVDLCDATKGRLVIQTSGVVSVQAEGATFSNAQCFTSLEGVSFAASNVGGTALTLQNGWTNGPSGTSAAKVYEIDGIVHFQGAVSGGSSQVITTLPAGMAPATEVYVPVDLCNATNGRLIIAPSGQVSVQPEHSFSDATCFTSLDGASFAPAATNFKALTLRNGWTNAPFATSNAAAEDIGGIVHLKGAIATSGTSRVPLKLPVAFRPPTNVYVPVDLCTATNGRLHIAPNGTVTVQAEGGKFSNARCFTSLDGVDFPTTEYVGLTLTNGWGWNCCGAFPAAAVTSGIVNLSGFITTALPPTSPQAFTLPVGYRPATNVFVPINVVSCGDFNGRLDITAGGAVTVEMQGGFPSPGTCPNAAAALDGASFAISGAGSTALSLQNGWTNGPFGTASATAEEINGIVHLEGAVASGTNSLIATLPAGMVPAANVYVPADLCGSANGRLEITTSGSIFVQTQSGNFSDAQCFTSLDGVSFAPSAKGFSAIKLRNGWTNAPFSTSNAAGEDIAGIVHLKGAISSGAKNLVFTLSPALRPSRDIEDLKVDLCGANNGYLTISSMTGAVDLAADTSFGNAQCFTSLDGVSFAK
jgi:hypothetical protein